MRYIVEQGHPALITLETNAAGNVFLHVATTGTHPNSSGEHVKVFGYLTATLVTQGLQPETNKLHSTLKLNEPEEEESNLHFEVVNKIFREEPKNLMRTVFRYTLLPPFVFANPSPPRVEYAIISAVAVRSFHAGILSVLE